MNAFQDRHAAMQADNHGAGRGASGPAFVASRRPGLRSGGRRALSAALAGVLGTSLAGVAGVVAAGPARAVGPGTPQSVTIAFDPTGQATWTVPADTWTVTVTGAGGSGAAGAKSVAYASGGAGGLGAKVTLTMDVTPGQTFNVYPGQAAQGSTPGWAADSLTGGYGGEGDILSLSGGVAYGGAGGSGTEVATNGALVLVAGGGGGGGGGGTLGPGGFGGQYGYAGASTTLQSGGAAGGTTWLAQKTGQSASAAPTFSYAGGGGGGGGGWTGRVGGGAAGGSGSYGGASGAGGGSGASNAFMGRNPSLNHADAAGDGWVMFNWTPGANAHVSLSASANPASAGQPVTFTDTVVPTSSTAPTPTGTVTFEEYSIAANTFTILGVVPLVSGAGSWTASGLTIGTHYIYAVWSGDNEYLPLSPELDENVNPSFATSALTVAPNPGVAGQSVTFTDALTPNAGGPTPTGTVTFQEYNTSTATLSTLGSAPLIGGVATWTSNTLPVGSHAISAQYGGDSIYGGSGSFYVTEVIDAAVLSVSATPNPVAFGNQVVGTTQTQDVTLTNNGNVPANFNGANTSNGDINMPATTCFGTLAPGASCKVTISYQPSVTGPDNGAVTLTGTPTTSLNVTGTGVASVLSVSSTPNPVAFGNQVVGTTQTQDVTLTNNGNVPANFNGANTSNGDINMPATTCFGTLAPGASCKVTISYQPSVTGPDNGAVTLTGTPATSLNVTGTGVAVIQSVSATPNPVAFGNQVVGTTQTQVVTLTNNGNVTVSFGNASTSNGDINMPATTCFANVAPGASCTVTVSYRPSVTGPDNGTITLYGTRTTSLTISGAGVVSPRVGSLSPRSGPKAGGTTITITGRNFLGVTGITVAGVPVRSFSCPSATRCLAVTGAGSGAGTVLVTNIAGTSPGNADAGFRYR